MKKAKRNNHLMDLIDRHRKWKLTHGQESDSDSGENSDSGDTEAADSDWDIGTIKEPVSPYIEDNGTTLAIGGGNVGGQTEVVHQNGGSDPASRARSPVKSAIERNQRHSPTKEAAPSTPHSATTVAVVGPGSGSAGLKDSRNVAKSEVNIVSNLIEMR